MELKLSIPQFLKTALYNDYQYTVIPAGRRTGKTYNLVQWIIEELLATDARHGLWVDTTQTNLDNYAARYFKPILKPIWHLCDYNSQKKTLSLPNGKYIDFRSATHPENIEGFEYDLFVLNEAGIILRNPDLWNITLQPMLKRAKGKIAGTPKGKNLFHQFYARGNDGDKQFKSFRFTAYDSPFYTKEEIELIKQNIPELAFQQNYMAEFLDGAGSVFRNIANCTRGFPVEKGTPGVSYMMGVDLAKYEDFTVITVGHNGNVVYKEKFNKLEWGFQKQRIVDVWNKFNRPRIIIDSTGVGDPIYDDLKKAGLNIESYKFTAESKKELVLNLAMALENETIHFPFYQDLIDELELYEYNISKSGNVSYNAPEGFHDDNVISLALLNYAMRQIVPISLSFI